MSDFIPPHPKRPKRTLNPIKGLYYARKDLLSMWPEAAFRVKFIEQKILGQRIFIANSPETIRYVFVTNAENYEAKSTQQVKALEPLLGDGMFVSHGDVWAKHRKILTPSFSTPHVRQYSEVMISTILEKAASWEQVPSGSPIEMLPEMSALAAEIISRTLFGEELGAENATAVVTAFATYQSVIKQMDVPKLLGFPSFPNLNGRFGRGKRATQTIHAVVDSIMEKATHADHQDTLAAQLLAANRSLSEEESMTREQIRNEIVVMFMAGHETTGNILSWMWYLLSQVPDVERRMHEELDNVLGGAIPTFDDVPKLEYTRAILDETMRLYPPVPLLSRRAANDDEINGKHVPANSNMLVVPWLIQRHELYWDKPNHFVPERFLPGAPKPDKYTYVPFSTGPRVCIGQTFGLNEMVLVFAILGQRFRATLAPGHDGGHDCRLTLRPKNNLPMMLIHR